MARLFRLWEKKRGDRRTGSPLAASVGEAAFFASLFLLGAVALAMLLAGQAMQPDPNFFTLGLGKWLILIVLTSFLLIGGAGFVLTVLEVGASAERRSALVRRAGDMEFIREVRQRGHEYPNVPRDADLTNSPGVRLKYRLPGLESPIWQLTAAAVTSLLCVGIAIALIVLAVQSFHAGRPQWALTGFLVAFSTVTVWVVYYFVRQLTLHTGIGPTNVEISAHPLQPGQTCEMWLVQSGRLHVRRLTIELVCEEEATFRQGTDVRSERRVVYREEIFCGEQFHIDPAKPFEQSGNFRVPCSAMHSFRSAHNAIHWKIVVTGDFVKWPSLVRSFPIVVYPLDHSPEMTLGTAH